MSNSDDDFISMMDEAMNVQSPRRSTSSGLATKHKAAIISSIVAALICTAFLGFVIGGAEGAVVAVLPIVVIAASVYWINRRNF